MTRGVCKNARDMKQGSVIGDLKHASATRSSPY